MAASAPLSPLAPKSVPTPPAIVGVRFATIAAGVRYAGRTDVMLALFDKPAAVAGVFTRSKCPSAPVDWCRAHLAGGEARALIVNSGNANAFTGGVGAKAVAHVGEAAAKKIGAGPNQIFMASTGVIGEPLDGAKIADVIDALIVKADANGLTDAAHAIMTTDTYPKIATERVKIGATEATVNGIAKGAGMIAPDMATMLSFVFTDAAIAAPALQTMLAKSAARSFNCITVDSDTSTSDTLLLFATGAAGGAPIADAADPALRPFQRALDKVLLDLAHQVVRDGEGARKFVEVRVEGAKSKKSAKRIALSIANSPLVKTAIAGEDANWGRIVMAVGKAGEPAERDKLNISFGKIRVARGGARDPDYSEEAVSTYMKREKIVITANIGIGRSSAKVWTCDLTKEYVAINGDYRS
ncbi:MAG TPA: bifunctional glutamate N-acetyltransferase/amino-acid acetyltransferase ArgJ [Roseiarcus sp.]|jgi:glutamate N-acetyltransferase/amino-acid N-acetyltransferase|nr:bifunctional glutamate N-acetyltransferase/amino-acid acetyltransferase ArgJ [Roseiarcus sp.]